MRRIASLLAGLYLALAAVWTATNLGRLPPYGDSNEYLELSRTLRVDEYRGLLYPLVLRAWDLVADGTTAILCVQLTQMIVGLLALAYFVNAFGRVAGGGSQRFGCGARSVLTLLLWLDPLVMHFNLSLMTDSLALSACLAFCAAVANLFLGVRERRARVVLVLSMFCAANLRVEKLWILLATALAFALIWRLTTRREELATRGRIAWVVGLALLATGATKVVHLATYTDHGRWALAETIVHQRVVFPHLTELRPKLSRDAREALTPRETRLYDRRIHNTWTVVDRVTKRDPEARRRLTDELLRVGLRERWPAIALDVASDFAENVIATPSFALRLVDWMKRGEPDAFQTRFEATPWTFVTLSFHSPRLSRSVVFAAFGLWALAFAAALVAFARSGRAPSGARLAWLPLALVVGLNAILFAATADLVHIRYVLLSHVALLFLLYGSVAGRSRVVEENAASMETD